MGGPATAAAVGTGVPGALQGRGVPVDFVTTHVYGNVEGGGVLGRTRTRPVPRDEMVWRAVQRVHAEIQRRLSEDAADFRGVIASYANEPDVTDTTTWGHGSPTRFASAMG